jgi:hypothetical protein
MASGVGPAPAAVPVTARGTVAGVSLAQHAAHPSLVGAKYLRVTVGATARVLIEIAPTTYAALTSVSVGCKFVAPCLAFLLAKWFKAT